MRPRRFDLLLAELKRTPDCALRPVAPSATPLRPGLEVPLPLRSFWSVCGGARLFVGGACSLELVGPDAFYPTNTVLFGQDALYDDRSDGWYVVGQNAALGQYISIDLAPERLGRCYDSALDHHGVIGRCPVVAEAFGYLLWYALEAAGRHWWWEQPGFAPLGDAYG